MAHSVFDLQASIGLDTSGFMQGMHNVMQSTSNMQHSLSGISGSVNSAQSSINNASSAVTGLGNNVQTSETSVNGLSDAINDLGNQSHDAETQSSHLGSGIHNAGEEAEKAAKNFVSFGDILKANVIGDLIVKGIETVISKIKQLGDTAVNAVTNFTKSSVAVGMNFDSSMSQVAATMGMTMQEMQDQVGEVDLAWGHFSGNLREYAQEMGKNTAFSATEAAQALNYMALAGYDAQKSMDMLPKVLNLASSGGMDLARASDMITDTQTALGLSLERTGELVDQMAKTASRSNTSVSQLGDAMLTIGANAKSLNGGLIRLEDGTTRTYDGTTELNAALGILADNGVKASEAGTALRNILNSLSGDKFQTNITEAFGISAYDEATGKMRSLKDIFADLNEVTSKMTQKERDDLISDVFNKYDTAKVKALLDTSIDRWDTLTGEILDAQGAAQAMANTQLDNLTGSITIFKSALEGAQIAISDKLSPKLSKFVKLGTQQLSSLTDAFEKKGLYGVIDSLPGFFKQWEYTFSAELAKIDTKKIQELSEKIGYTIRDSIYKAIAKIPQGRQNFGKIIKNAIESITRNLPAVTDTIVKLVDKIGDSFEYGNGLTGAGTVGRFVKAVVKAIGKIGDAVVRNAPRVLKGVMSDLGDVIVDVFPGLEGIKEKIDENLGKISESFSGAYDKIKESVDPIAEKISDFFSDEEDVKTATDDISTAVDTLGTTISTAIGFIGDIVSAIGDFINWVTGGSDGADSLVVAVGAAVTALATFKAALAITGAIAAFQTAVAAIPGIITGVITAITGIGAFLAANPIAVAVAAIAALVASLVILYNTNDDFKAFVDEWVDNWKVGEKALEDFGGEVYDFVQEVKENWEIGIKELEDFGGSVYDAVESFKENWKSGEKSLEDFGGSVYDALEQAKNNLSEFWADAGLTLTEKVQSFLEWIQKIPDKIAEMVDNAKNWGTNLIGNFFSGISEKLGSSPVFAKLTEKLLGIDTNDLTNSANIPAAKADTRNTANVGGGVTINYTQNNTSPQALDEYEIWRQNKRAMDDLRANLGGVW